MYEVTVSLGTCGIAAGAREVNDALIAGLQNLDISARVSKTGCLGLCYREVNVRLDSPELGDCLYGDVTPDRVPELLRAHFHERRVVDDLCINTARGQSTESAFLEPQHRIALRNCGHLDPDSLDDYLERGGYQALDAALIGLAPEAVIAEIKTSGLRGRGGAGFTTADKWAIARATPGDEKYIICNADEGDPGAFMDRNLIEGDPFNILEGMTLAAYAVGASRGIVYVRAEYPLAVDRIATAVAAARRGGYLGRGIRGSQFEFDIEVKRGAGAFVCGEETALIASLEGRRGMPRLRPPFPVESGLWGRPTVINNVETWANVPWIIANGAESYRQHGVGKSRGTKVFSLAGDVRRTGLVEVPMGTTIREIVEDIGGGSRSGRPLKAVQIGGPAGGCLPESLFDTPIDYESLAETGAIMGSGGLIVLDDSHCMVEVARYFLAFTQVESCGKCTFCRIGTKRMLEILDRLCAGEGQPSDLAQLEALAPRVQQTSLCGLGRAAPNPVLTTLVHFRDEYTAHIEHKRCPSRECRKLITYSIERDLCDGCTMCMDQCVAGAIERLPSLRSRMIPLNIDPDACVRCGGCQDVCEFAAIAVA